MRKHAKIAQQYLRIIPEKSKCFFCVDCSLYEFRTGLEQMSEETFKYHSNKKKSDFAQWIYDVIGDKILARMVEKLKDDKNKTLITVSRRIKKLEDKIDNLARTLAF